MDRVCEEDRDQAPASAPTLNRLELGGERADRYHKITHDAAKVEACLLQMGVRCLDPHAPEVIVDLDATGMLVHGTQAGRHFHAYDGDYCYLPSYAFAGNIPLWAQLRTSDRDAADGAAAAQWCLTGGAPTRRFVEFEYRTLDSWSRARRGRHQVAGEGGGDAGGTEPSVCGDESARERVPGRGRVGGAIGAGGVVRAVVLRARRDGERAQAAGVGFACGSDEHARAGLEPIAALAGDVITMSAIRPSRSRSTAAVGAAGRPCSGFTTPCRRHRIARAGGVRRCGRSLPPTTTALPISLGLKAFAFRAGCANGSRKNARCSSAASRSTREVCTAATMRSTGPSSSAAWRAASSASTCSTSFFARVNGVSIESPSTSGRSIATFSVSRSPRHPRGPRNSARPGCGSPSTTRVTSAAIAGRCCWLAWIRRRATIVTSTPCGNAPSSISRTTPTRSGVRG